MESEDIKKIRNQIREVLLSSDELRNIDSLNSKKTFQDLKKDCYDKLVDLKNGFETVQENPDNKDAIRKIDDLIQSLNQVKKFLGNQL